LGERRAGVGGCNPTVHHEREAKPGSKCRFGEWIRRYDGATSERRYGAVACGGGKRRVILVVKPVTIVPEIEQEGVFFIVLTVTGKGTKVVMDRGEGGKSGGLIRVVLWFAPDKVCDGDSFIRHEGV
jgi:hypothetical protein